MKLYVSGSCIFLVTYRRAALYIWKQRLGSDATYQKLIDVFECAGYRIYADIVRNTVYTAESDCSDCDEPIPQPETYPHHKLSSPPSPTLSTSPHKVSSSAYDEYLLINPATAQGLPEGENYRDKYMCVTRLRIKS